MTRLSTFCFAAAIAIVGLQKVAPADETAGIPDEMVEVFDGFVGNWKVEGKIGDKERTGNVTLRWERTENKKKVCLIGRFSYVTGDETRSGVTLIGWNADRKCIEDRGFDGNGGNAVLYWNVETPTHWKGEIIATGDGKTVTAKADLIK